MNRHDFIVVGSGINGLVCSAILARHGNDVLLLERNDRIGGCLRTEELIEPGFRHDVLATWFPLFLTSPAYAELGEELARYGATFVSADKPTAAVLPDNTVFTLVNDRQKNVAAMNERSPGDGDAYAAALASIEASANLSFALLGQQLRRPAFAKLLARAAWKSGIDGLAGFVGDALVSCRGWLESSLRDRAVQACLASWVLHVGLNPESSFSGHLAKIIAFTLEQTGMPVVRGGNQVLLDAFRGLIEARGGTIKTSSDVDEIVTASGRATGVKLASGESFAARKGVICSVTPTQLYARLLRAVDIPAAVRDSAARYRYGLGDMQIHLALKEPPAWVNRDLADVAMVHVTEGINAISKAVNEGTRGLLPAASTIVVGQPHAVDPSRAPAGQAILWIQILDVPRRVFGDVLGEIPCSEDGAWSEPIREAFADRIMARVGRHITNLDTATIGRVALSPEDLQALNINLVGGDPYGGFCGLEQSFLWRPGIGTRNNDTPVKSLYHIGASTHPGPGLSGASGYLTARQLV